MAEDFTLLAFEKFGLPIAFLIVMIWLYTKERQEHRTERKDWKDSQQHLQKDTNAVLRDLTKVISKMDDR